MSTTKQSIVHSRRAKRGHKHCSVVLTVGMSEFKRNPTAVLRGANLRPVAVLQGKRLALYAIEPRLFQALLEEIADHELHLKVAGRLTEKSHAVEVHIDDL
jgi:antitoxin StbD